MVTGTAHCCHSFDQCSKGDSTEPSYGCNQKEQSVTCDYNPLFLDVSSSSSNHCSCQHTKTKWHQVVFGAVKDPRSRYVQKLTQFFLLIRFISLAVDPSFFYIITIKREDICVFMDRQYAILFTCFRSVCDVVHLFHIWLQFNLAYISKESLILGNGSLVWDAKKIAWNYAHSSKGFLFDLFVILPLPQVIIWFVLPSMISMGHITNIITVCGVAFSFQYIPKIVHLVLLARNVQSASGFIFGTVWWGFALNLTAYYVAAYVAGSCWYLLASQRVMSCLIQNCKDIQGCYVKDLGCKLSHTSSSMLDTLNLLAVKNETTLLSCLSTNDYGYGIFQEAIPLLTSKTWSAKFFYPFFWGLMTFSTFGNSLQPSYHTLELVFCNVVVTCGLLLFALLIGNIQVFLRAIVAKPEAMRLRLRDVEYWMHKRRLPSNLRNRVRKYQQHNWSATQGVDESEIINSLPEGMRRDIKCHLTLDLVLQVPLFEHMDRLVLENICERLKPFLFIKGETVINQGDPVHRMLFIMRGHFLSSHDMRNGTSACGLGPGSFCGDELLTWCLKKPSNERLPPSYATLTTLDNVEAFGLDSEDLKFVINHFGHKFVKEKLRRTARYYSVEWRTWAVVTIQIAWRRFQEKRGKLYEEEFWTNKSPRISASGRLRLYTAIITSPKPQDH